MTETERVTDKTLRAWLNGGAVHRGSAVASTLLPPPPGC